MWLWTWIWQKLAFISQYLLIQYKGLRFEYDARCAIKQKRNLQTLFNILKQNRNTEILVEQRKKMGLHDDQNLDSFK